MDEQRLDKWLWCARFFKSRGLASTAIKNGRIDLNGQRSKPARTVKPGDQLVVRREEEQFSIEILGLSQQRLAAARVGELYLESEESKSQRTALREARRIARQSRETIHGKPTKKDRRDGERLKRSI